MVSFLFHALVRWPDGPGLTNERDTSQQIDGQNSAVRLKQNIIGAIVLIGWAVFTTFPHNQSAVLRPIGNDAANIIPFKGSRLSFPIAECPPFLVHLISNLLKPFVTSYIEF